jgi:hypothetical protein
VQRHLTDFSSSSSPSSVPPSLPVHSVFQLRLSGANSVTGEKCSGALNLIDLAGSERLDKSDAGSSAERLRESQAINKSLATLGDVIAALSAKLTHLLQHFFGGDSKCLMFVNVNAAADSLGGTHTHTHTHTRARRIAHRTGPSMHLSLSL